MSDKDEGKQSGGLFGFLDKADQIMSGIETVLPDAERDERKGGRSKIIDVEPEPERTIDLGRLRENLLSLKAKLKGEELKEYKLIISEVYAACFASTGLVRGNGG